ncbi:MAG: LptE family protein [Olleya sp.]
MKYLKYSLLIIIASTLLGCGAYSFTGVQDLGDAKTFQVNYFQNNAPLVEPGLERDFKIALEDLIQNQTSLSLVPSNGDLVYEGEITEYRISPTTATSNSTAAQNRLTIGVKVRFYNKKDDENDFEKSFSFFYDYEGSELLTGATKTTAFEEIFERLTQDIFNASLANW